MNTTQATRIDRRRSAARRGEDQVERSVYWILGACTGLIIGYAWGQFDGHQSPAGTPSVQTDIR